MVGIISCSCILTRFSFGYIGLTPVVYASISQRAKQVDHESKYKRTKETDIKIKMSQTQNASLKQRWSSKMVNSFLILLQSKNYEL